MIFTVTLVLFILSLISMMVIMGIWTYYDAKNKGLNAPLWTMVVLLGQNFVGLILYMLIGRKEEKTFCTVCNTLVLKTSKFCNHCGEKLEYNVESKPISITRKPKKYLISFIISAVIFIGSTAGFILSLAYEDTLPMWNGVSIGMVTNNQGDKWNVSFKTSGETLQETINRKADEPKTLYFSGSCEEGILTLYIMQSDTILAYDISAENKEMSADLSAFDDGKITLILTNTNAKNVTFHSHWE